MGGRVAGQFYIPTLEMSMNAKRGLSLFDRYGRGGSKRRLDLGKDIAERRAIAESDWRRIAGFHARSFGMDDPQSYTQYSDGGEDARYIASMIMGGVAGRDYSFSLIPDLNKG
jgi:hypothetical protein